MGRLLCALLVIACAEPAPEGDVTSDRVAAYRGHLRQLEIVARQYDRAMVTSTADLCIAVHRTYNRAVRAIIAAQYRGWIDTIGARLVAQGHGTEPARRIASFALAAIEGGLLLAKVTRSIAPLREVGETLRLMVSSLPAPTNRVA